MDPILLGKGITDDIPVTLQPKFGNRHGLVAGATGTGKTVTLMTLAEGFSRMGVPVFMADVKGDVAGLAAAGDGSERVMQRAKDIGIADYAPGANPVIFWDLYGKLGHPVRTTVSEMGPTLLSRILELNDTQSGVLDIVFKLADDRGLLLLDLEDLRALLGLVAAERKDISTSYGLVSTQSVGAIQRALLRLEQEGGEMFFGEPALELADLMRTNTDGRGVIGIPDYVQQPNPVIFWDLWGQKGHPIRTTVSEMGPTLLARILELNDTQAGVLDIVFKLADDRGLLLLDLEDLRALLGLIADERKDISTSYGLVSAPSIGAIQRALLRLEQEGADQFFGEPALELADLMRTTPDGRGVVNILAADQLILKPKLYSSFLLWLLSELFETLPEVGDLDKPKLVFVFDEAHLLFDDAPPALRQRIEQVVRIIRSKGVGVFFVTQNPLDIPDTVLGQLGNRVQHALRAFTPRDQKAVKSAADTMRANPGLDIATAITELAVGEALVSLLDEKGRPGVTQRVFVVPPGSQIGPITPAQRQALISQSLVAGVYEQVVDRESAHEKLKGRAAGAAAPTPPQDADNRSLRDEAQDAVRAPRSSPSGTGRSAPAESGGGWLGDLLQGSGRKDSVLETVAKSAARTIGSTVGREIIRGVLGSLLGGSRRR